jgi:lipoyl(octanoyl) transferase
MNYQWRGLVPYEKALQDQLLLLQTAEEVVWGLEHPSVITLGLRAEAHGEIHDDPIVKSTIVRVDRGGKATLHNEGQLVIYPQFVLADYGFGVRTYVEALVRVTRSLLQELNVEILPDGAEVGLFTSKGKIGALGIRVQNGRVYHGLALNVCNNLVEFNAIRSCGVWNRPQDNVHSWGVTLNTENIYWLWVKHWQNFLLTRVY